MQIRSNLARAGFSLMLGLSFWCHELPEANAADSVDLTGSRYSLWNNLEGGFKDLGTRQSARTFAIGLFALGVARAGDEEANDYFRGQHRIGNWNKLGNEVLGTGVPGALIAAGFWLYGDLQGKDYERHAGQAHLETLFVTGVMTAIGKGVFNRERPDAGDRFAFPSGHSSTAFASATALYEFYGWKVGAPAYALAVLTGVSRVSDGRHWLSDVTGGALLGILVGQAYSRYHLGLTSSGIHVSWMPVVIADGGGITMRAEF